MKDYKKPLIEDEMIEINDICVFSNLTESDETPGVGSGDNVEQFPSL